jgi:hypothetical protein
VQHDADVERDRARDAFPFGDARAHVRMPSVAAGEPAVRVVQPPGLGVDELPTLGIAGAGERVGRGGRGNRDADDEEEGGGKHRGKVAVLQAEWGPRHLPHV